jgi:hypothetical protein
MINNLSFANQISPKSHEKVEMINLSFWDVMEYGNDTQTIASLLLLE